MVGGEGARRGLCTGYVVVGGDQFVVVERLLHVVAEKRCTGTFYVVAVCYVAASISCSSACAIQDKPVLPRTTFFLCYSDTSKKSVLLVLVKIVLLPFGVMAMCTYCVLGVLCQLYCAVVGEIVGETSADELFCHHHPSY